MGTSFVILKSVERLTLYNFPYSSKLSYNKIISIEMEFNDTIYF